MRCIIKPQHPTAIGITSATLNDKAKEAHRRAGRSEEHVERSDEEKGSSISLSLP
jgi:hypothetical protein